MRFYLCLHSFMELFHVDSLLIGLYQSIEHNLLELKMLTVMQLKINVREMQKIPLTIRSDLTDIATL